MLYELVGKPKSQENNLQPVPLASLKDAGWLEKDLEDLLASRLNDILREDQLMVIFQERQWQEEPDILALDQHGTLFIFELKRWKAEKDNLLQVIRYGQIFGQLSYDELEVRFLKDRDDKKAELVAKHQAYFGLDRPLSKADFNQNQRFIVVTAGIDRETLDALAYWKCKQMPIDALVYHVYRIDNKGYFLDFPRYSPTGEDYLAILSNDWVVNTNVTYMPDAYKEMLDMKKASAYGDRKHAVNKIQKGDRVFLYHTGVGIMAWGRAKDRCCTSKENSEEHFIPLEFEYTADPLLEGPMCLPAYAINRKLGASHRFRQTAFGISKEMGDEIVRLLKKLHPPTK